MSSELELFDSSSMESAAESAGSTAVSVAVRAVVRAVAASASGSTVLAAAPGPSLLDGVLAAGIDMVFDTSCFRRSRGRALIVGSTVSRALEFRHTAKCWRTWVANVDSGRHIHRLLNRAIRVVLHTELRRGYNSWEAKWREQRDGLQFVRRVMGRMMHFQLAASVDRWRRFRGEHAHKMRAMRRGAALLVASGLMTGFARWRAHHAHRTANLLMLRRAGGGLGRRQIAWGFRRMRNYGAGRSAATRGLAALGHTSYMRAWNSWLELVEARGLNRKCQTRALSRYAEQETLAALDQLRRRVREARIVASAARHLLSRSQARAWEAWVELRELRRHAFGLLARALAVLSNRQLSACVRRWARAVNIGLKLGGAMALLSVEGLQKGWRAWADAVEARHASLRLLRKSLALLRAQGLHVACAIWRHHGHAHGVLRLAVRHLSNKPLRAGWNSWLGSVDSRQAALGRVRRALALLGNRSLAGAFRKWRTLRELAVLTGAAAHRVALLVDYAALGLEKLTVALLHARFHALRRGWRGWLHTSSLLSRPAAAAALLARRVAKRRLRVAEGEHRAIVDAAATRWERREKRAAHSHSRPLMLEAQAAHRILALSAAFDLWAYDADVAPDRPPTHTRATAASIAAAAASSCSSAAAAAHSSASAVATPPKRAGLATELGADAAATDAAAPMAPTPSYAVVASNYATPTSTMPVRAVGSYVVTPGSSGGVMTGCAPPSGAMAGHVVPAYPLPSNGAAVDAVATYTVAGIAPAGYPAPPPQPVMMQVEVPAGVLPGQQMLVQAPDGTTVVVVLPPNLAPGQTFQVALPADTPGASAAPPPPPPQAVAPPAAAATGAASGGAVAPPADDEGAPSRTSSLAAATGSGDDAAGAASKPRRAKSTPSGFPAPPPRAGSGSAAGAAGAAAAGAKSSPAPSPRSGGPPVMRFHQPPGRGSLQRQHTVSWLNPAPPRGADKADLRKKRLYNSQRKGLIAEFTPSKTPPDRRASQQ